MNSSDRGVSYWVDIADYDLETAEVMLTTKRYLYVGFICRTYHLENKTVG